MQPAVKQYLKEVDKRISCPSSLKRNFLHQLRSELECLADGADTDLTLLAEEFGPPEELAEEFLSELGSRAAARYLKTRRRLLTLVLAVAVMALTALLGLGMREYRLQKKFAEEAFYATINYAPEEGETGRQKLVWESQREAVEE